jgi:light-regulated signal transduction histidine kinase (bacteriophytochrome)
VRAGAGSHRDERTTIDTLDQLARLIEDHRDEAHDGVVTVESRLGAGSTFRFTLPRRTT